MKRSSKSYDEDESKTGKSKLDTSANTIKIIPLGGLGEIGKNTMAIMCGNDIMLVDAGLAFPTEEQLGVDLVLPDITFLRENQDKIRGLAITHGHERSHRRHSIYFERRDYPGYLWTGSGTGIARRKIKRKWAGRSDSFAQSKAAPASKNRLLPGGIHPLHSLDCGFV